MFQHAFIAHLCTFHAQLILQPTRIPIRKYDTMAFMLHGSVFLQIKKREDIYHLKLHSSIHTFFCVKQTSSRGSTPQKDPNASNLFDLGCFEYAQIAHRHVPALG